MNDPFDEKNAQDLDKLATTLGKLALASPPEGFVDRGVQFINAVPATPVWKRRLPLALAAALVVSVSANVFQLVHNRHQLQTLESEQLVQCNTPVAALPADTTPEVKFITVKHPPNPQGMC